MTPNVSHYEATHPQVIRPTDEHEAPVKLVRFQDFVPSEQNRDPLKINLPARWVKRQLCPGHGLRNTHVLATWGKWPTNTRLDCIVVRFMCQIGHEWQIHLRPKN